MHTSLQAAARLHRVPNGVSFSPQCKNDAINVKFKRREKLDRTGDSMKPEISMKSEDGTSNRTHEHSEDGASKEVGHLTVASADKFVHMMRQEQLDSETTDIPSHRMSLVSIIASTESEDCLAQFVQLGGLSVLDGWLQEAHTGKLGDACGPTEGTCDKLALTLLHALERLPIDLDALKTCMVGKSVNNLRTHKNLEVQKKARKLVETWKKRVDAEMKTLDEAWSSKHPNLRSHSQVAKVHSMSPKGFQNSGKHKKLTNGIGTSTSFAEDTSDIGMHDEISNHQRIIVRLPNPARSPSRRVATSSKALSQGSNDKLDVTDLKGKHVADSPDSFGDAKSSSHNADHSLSRSSGVCDPPITEYNTWSTHQLYLPCERVTDSVKTDSGIALLANIAASGSVEADRTVIDHEKNTRKDKDALEGACSPESKPVEEKFFGAMEQGLDENVEVSSHYEGLTAGAANFTVGEKGSNDQCQKSVDMDLGDGSFGDCIATDPSSPCTSGNADTKSKDPTSEYNYEDDALAVARQVAMEVEQEVNGIVKADSSNSCKSETSLGNLMDENSPRNTKVEAPERRAPTVVCLNHFVEGERHKEELDVSNKAVAPLSTEAGMGDHVVEAGDGNSRRPLFDLNEGLLTEEPFQEPVLHSSGSLPNQAQVGAFSNQLPAPVAVVTATKGPFIPPSDLLKCRAGELSGWKGSAATSAFRPAEPRYLAVESFQSPSDMRNKRARVLDFDLNVADESEDMVTSARIDLDLNDAGLADEPSGPAYGGVSASTMQVRNFDLNDGLDVEGVLYPVLPQSKPTRCFISPEFPVNSAIMGSSTTVTDSISREAFPVLKPGVVHTNTLCSNDTLGNGLTPSSSFPFASSLPSVLLYGGFPFVSGFPYPSAMFSLSNMQTSSVVPPFVATPSAANTAVMPSHARMGVPELSATGNLGSYWARPCTNLNGEDASSGFCMPPLNQLSFQQGGPSKRKEPEPHFDSFQSGCRQLA